MPAPNMPAGELPVTHQDIEKLGADTFSKLLLRHGLQRGQKPAIREKHRGIWRTLTWRDLAEEVTALAGALSKRGLRRGAHVAFVGDNRSRLYAAMGAAQWLGAVAVPLYPDASAEEMGAPLQCASATHVFAENQEQVDKLLRILPRCPTIQCIVYDKDRGMRHYRQSLLVSYADLLREGQEFAAARRDALRAEVARGSGQDAAFLFFTSGTSSPGKAVLLTHEALIDRARVMATTEGLKHSDMTMAYLPPGWIGQCLFSYVLPMVVGHCVCCPESSDSLLADMREMGPTCLVATPGVLEALRRDVSARMEDTIGFSHRLYLQGMAAAQRISTHRLAADTASMGDRIVSAVCGFLINAPLRDVLGLGRARAVYTVGDAVAPEVLTFFRALGINLKQLHGSTETGCFVSIPRDDVEPDTVGRSGEGVELKIAPIMTAPVEFLNAPTALQPSQRAFAVGGPILELDSISLRFGGVQALTDVSFDVLEHEVRAIIGPNGAGKSSMLNVINGLYKAQQGSIAFRGQRIMDMTPTRAARLGIARTFQNIALFRGMSVLDNIMAGRALRVRANFLKVAMQLPRARREETANREAVEEIIEFLQIEHVRKTPVARLPYGLQKRVELGRALAAEPAMLLLDEPMAGMNIEEKHDLSRFILEVNDHYGTTIVLIEHDMGVVMDISDRVVVLDYGKKIGDGTPDEVRSNQAVIDAYLGVAH